MRPSVLFIPEAFHGGYRIRSEWPAKVLRARGWNARVMYPKWDPKDFAEVVIIHRSLGPEKAEMVRHFIARGARVVLSEDDDLWHTPHREGVRMNPLYPETIRATEAAAVAAHMVITTTEPLAKTFGAHTSAPVRVVRNYLPAWVGKMRRSDPRRERPIIQWRGNVAAYHRDLAYIRPHIPALLALPIRFSFVGDLTGPTEYLGIPTNRIAGGRDWTNDARALYAAMARADLGIKPLMPGAFNEAKSWLAGLEYASLGVPAIATTTFENRLLSTITGSVQAIKNDEWPAAIAEWLEFPWEPDTERMEALALEEHVWKWEEAIMEVRDAR